MKTIKKLSIKYGSFFKNDNKCFIPSTKIAKNRGKKPLIMCTICLNFLLAFKYAYISAQREIP